MKIDNNLKPELLIEEFGDETGEHLWNKFQQLGTLYFLNSLDHNTFVRITNLLPYM